MGGKRVEVDTTLQPTNKCAKRSIVGDDDDDDDRISRMPDDILIDILSLLSLKEAASTSALSSRWMNLWKHTSSLSFVAKEFPFPTFEKRVNSVNSVVQSHKSITLKEFTIRFTLTRSSTESITQWLEFAFSRRVQRLELNLQFSGSLSEYYTFPEKLLKSQTPSNGFSVLKELTLKSVHLNDGIIEFFLHNCPLIERLVVNQTYGISNLEVCGPSLKLKHLEIVYCMGLQSLKVSSPNLTSIRLMGSNELLLEYVPMLIDVCVSCLDDGDSLRRWFSELSCCISQLEILCLELVNIKGIKGKFGKFPEMRKLKKLVVKFYADGGNESLVKLTALIRASPCLEEFELKYRLRKLPTKDRQVKDPMRCPHHRLKVFKFCRYYGRARDDELVKYILQNCIALERIIVVPDKLDVEQIARKNAEQLLQSHVPHHVEFVIL